ncbi:hypothetical protein P7C70_g5102, partial [Phenoliferia sp. Uapishka_3]
TLPIPSSDSSSSRRPSLAGSEVSTSSAAVSSAESTETEGGGKKFTEDGKPSEEQVSEVDAALMRLDEKLEVVRKEFADVESQVSPLFDESPDPNDSTAFLRRKWIETAASWESIQKDAEMLNDELKEDKWLTVFRTVSQQAEDMMTSLEKVLKQSHEFIWDLNRRQTGGGGGELGTPTPSGLVGGAGATTFFGDPATIQPLLSSFVALHRSLHAKVKYYSPACDRVLKILGKGISDRSTKNGEVLRRFSEMKTRWRNLLERISRIEGEMRGVEDLLRDAAAVKADESPGKTPPGSIKEGSINGAGSTGKASPFRKLANKLTTSTSSKTSLASAASSPASTPIRATIQKPNIASTRNTTTASTASPPRPPRSDKRSASSMGVHNPPPTYGTPQPQSRPPPTFGHRSTRSVSGLNGHFNNAGLTPPQPPRSRRSPSPSPSASNDPNKPRWNISTKREEKEVLRESTGRLGTYLPGRSGTPSGRTSAMGLRSVSRMSLARSVGGGSRAGAVSPAFSNFSDASSSFVRERPMTPSRIPVPASASRIPSSAGARYGSFSSLDDPESTSLLQRTMTPTASPSRLNSSTSSRSNLPIPSSSLSPPRGPSPSPSAFSQSSFGGSYLYRGQTPEPTLAAQAQRISNIRLPYSRPAPPVPSLPNSLRESTSTPRPRVRGTTVRPASALSRSMNGSNFPSSSSIASLSQSYHPNPLDPLDLQIAQIVNALPVLLRVERLDAPLDRNARIENGGVGSSAKYSISLAERPRASGGQGVMCKLVDKVGPRVEKGEKKVLVRVGTGWMELEAWCLEIVAGGMSCCVALFFVECVAARKANEYTNNSRACTDLATPFVILGVTHIELELEYNALPYRMIESIKAQSEKKLLTRAPWPNQTWRPDTFFRHRLRLDRQTFEYTEKTTAVARSHRLAMDVITIDSSDDEAPVPPKPSTPSSASKRQSLKKRPSLLAKGQPEPTPSPARSAASTSSQSLQRRRGIAVPTFPSTLNGGQAVELSLDGPEIVQKAEDLARTSKKTISIPKKDQIYESNTDFVICTLAAAIHAGFRAHVIATKASTDGNIDISICCAGKCRQWGLVGRGKPSGNCKVVGVMSDGKHDAMKCPAAAGKGKGKAKELQEAEGEAEMTPKEEEELDELGDDVDASSEEGVRTMLGVASLVARPLPTYIPASTSTSISATTQPIPHPKATPPIITAQKNLACPKVPTSQPRLSKSFSTSPQKVTAPLPPPHDNVTERPLEAESLVSKQQVPTWSSVPGKTARPAIDYHVSLPNGSVWASGDAFIEFFNEVTDTTDVLGSRHNAERSLLLGCKGLGLRSVRAHNGLGYITQICSFKFGFNKAPDAVKPLSLNYAKSNVAHSSDCPHRLVPPAGLAPPGVGPSLSQPPIPHHNKSIENRQPVLYGETSSAGFDRRTSLQLPPRPSMEHQDTRMSAVSRPFSSNKSSNQGGSEAGPSGIARKRPSSSTPTSGTPPPSAIANKKAKVDVPPQESILLTAAPSRQHSPSFPTVPAVGSSAPTSPPIAGPSRTPLEIAESYDEEISLKIARHLESSNAEAVESDTPPVVSELVERTSELDRTSPEAQMGIEDQAGREASSRIPSPPLVNEALDAPSVPEPEPALSAPLPDYKPSVTEQTSHLNSHAPTSQSPHYPRTRPWLSQLSDQLFDLSPTSDLGEFAHIFVKAGIDSQSAWDRMVKQKMEDSLTFMQWLLDGGLHKLEYAMWADGMRKKRAEGN